MAKTTKDNSKKPVQEPSTSFFRGTKEFFKSDGLHFFIGLVFVVLAFYLLVTFTSYFFNGAADQSLVENATAEELASVDNGIQNDGGSVGARVSHYFINNLFGVPAYFIVIFLMVAGLKLMRVRKFRLWKWFIFCMLFMYWGSVFLSFVFQHIYQDSFFYLGGLHGYNVSRWLESQVGATGVFLLLLLTALCFLIYFSSKTVIYLRKLFTFSFLKRQKKEEELKEEELVKETEAEEEKENVFDLPLEKTPTAKVEKVADDMYMTVQENVKDDTKADDSKDPDFIVEAAPDTEEADPSKQEPYDPRLDLQYYKFPTVDLLKQYDDEGPSIDMDEQNANKNRIVNTLHSFGVEISSIKATVGPTVTLYEITPAQGVRINKIRNLEDDIALSLSALGVRIIAPIPGKGTIGIEVPNEKKNIVSGQSVIGSKKFQESKMELPCALGKTISNEVFMVDLAKMPHVLVAGATGQGKSVGLNAMITSLLYKKHPAELKFVLVDPKKLEFSIYSAIENHFLAELPDSTEPIVTDVTKVVQTLNSVCKEMDTRYDLMKLAGVRNIKEYNEKFINRRLNPEKGHRYMPYIVVVIDEFGDLIMTAGREVELPIARIAQLARAAGIHMIIATQRPTTNIITGTIKANFPARIAFRVASMIDSRTILDRPGANQLIGRGDMLFLQGSDPVRVQCAFIDTPEVSDICNFIAKQQGYTSPFYLPEPDQPETDGPADVDMERLDPLFEDAARLIVVHQQGSTSLIQRKFAIGYNRAGRLMDQLEKAGIVGAAQGSKPRDVLISDEMSLENVLAQLK